MHFGAPALGPRPAADMLVNVLLPSVRPEIVNLRWCTWSRAGAAVALTDELAGGGG
jgi:hypothetical protein